jgi:hypothetical protein
MIPDYKNPAPQIESHGRLYRASITFSFFIPEGVTATEAQLEEWLMWETNMYCTGPDDSNPLSKIYLDIDNAELSDLRDMKARRFTEWGPQESDGRRHGKRKTVPDGTPYNPIWVEPA